MSIPYSALLAVIDTMPGIVPSTPDSEVLDWGLSQGATYGAGQPSDSRVNIWRDLEHEAFARVAVEYDFDRVWENQEPNANTKAIFPTTEMTVGALARWGRALLANNAGFSGTDANYRSWLLLMRDITPANQALLTADGYDAIIAEITSLVPPFHQFPGVQLEDVTFARAL